VAGFKQLILEVGVMGAGVRLPGAHMKEILAGHAGAGILADRQPRLGSAPLIEIVGRAGAAHAGRHPSRLQGVREHAGPAASDGEGQQNVVQLALGIGLGGVVTLSVEERKGPSALEISSGRDRFAPRPHRRGAEGAMRLG
jgi:hypothetical protein